MQLSEQVLQSIRRRALLAIPNTPVLKRVADIITAAIDTHLIQSRHLEGRPALSGDSYFHVLMWGWLLCSTADEQIDWTIQICRAVSEPEAVGVADHEFLIDVLDSFFNMAQERIVEYRHLFQDSAALDGECAHE